MLPSPKVQKHLTEIKKAKFTSEELRELLKAIAQDFQIPIQIAGESDDEDFWALSPEDEQRFNGLLSRATDDLKNKRYSEYRLQRLGDGHEVAGHFRVVYTV